ncbi:MAG: hypothetical protein E6Q97_30910 [Desulfurellales bacterium]|nr:MAG: hypothetical protein E6Q97_30910 [Desulfurellales bacterium]
MTFLPASVIPIKDRITCCVWGPPKSGKTTFALTFPEPIYYFLWDSGGLDHHLAKIKKMNRDISVAMYDLSTVLEVDDAGPVLKDFGQDFDYACTATTEKGTIVFDTSTELWKLYQQKMYADVTKQLRAKGKEVPERMPQRFYDKPNEDWRQKMHRIKHGTSANLVMIEREKPVYDSSGQDTGRKARQGQSSNSYETQLTLRMGVDKDPGGKIQSHYVVVEAAGLADSDPLIGMRLEYPTYTMLKSLIGGLSG